MGIPWNDEIDLARILFRTAKNDRIARLKPATAHFVALRLMSATLKPTRDEVARLICRMKCQELCYDCKGRANLVVREYGSRFDKHGPFDSADIIREMGRLPPPKK